jgi:hypothetical protein
MIIHFAYQRQAQALTGSRLLTANEWLTVHPE